MRLILKINIFSTILSLLIPKLTALFIDTAIPQKNYYILVCIAIGQLVAIALTCLAQVFSMYFGEKIALLIIKTVRYKFLIK